MSLTEIIRNRRAIFPKSYLPEESIDKAFLEEVLENANHAPTHKLTEPWRFRVFHSKESRIKLGQYLSDYYKDNTPESEFSKEKMQKAGDNPIRSAAVIAVIMHRNASSGLPEWEEIAAVAMAVQNMWLTCTANGLGAYWSTPKAALQVADIFDLKENERPLGLFYIGKHNMPKLMAQRKPVEDKTIWF